MSTKVSAFMGGLGIDARDKLEIQDNATVTIGGASTGNVVVGGVVSVSNTNPSQSDTLVVGGNLRLTSGQKSALSKKAVLENYRTDRAELYHKNI